MTIHPLHQLGFSFVLVIVGIWLIDPAACSHPARLLPDCLDAPHNVECK